MNKQTALSLIIKALEEKTVGVKVRAFINTCRVASRQDLITLYEWVLNGKEALTSAYKDAFGAWHFITIA